MPASITSTCVDETKGKDPAGGRRWVTWMSAATKWRDRVSSRSGFGDRDALPERHVLPDLLGRVEQLPVEPGGIFVRVASGDHVVIARLTFPRAGRVGLGGTEVRPIDAGFIRLVPSCSVQGDDRGCYSLVKSRRPTTAADSPRIPPAYPRRCGRKLRAPGAGGRPPIDRWDSPKRRNRP